MSSRLLFSTLLLSAISMEAACIPQNQTENRDDIVYQLPDKERYTGCISKMYPNDRIMANLFYKDGVATGEGTRWYENGQKESEIIFKDGKIAYKRAWSEDGFLYESERYRDGVLLSPMEMPYTEAMKACQDATFDSYDQWRLPTIKELHAIPFSDGLAEKTYIASDAPQKDGDTKTVSYMRFAGSEAAGRWDDHILDIDTPFHVVCIRSDAPREHRLILGMDGEADLDSDSERKEEEAEAPVEVSEATAAADLDASVDDPDAPPVFPSPTPSVEEEPVEEVYPVTLQGTMHQERLREGYYIIAYTYSNDAPTPKDLEKITLAGYRYTTIKTKSDGGDHNYTLIGPFPTTFKAGKELRRVHERVQPNAYVVINTH